MRHKLFTVVQVMALVIVGTLAGTTAGKVVPLLPGMPSVSAATLDVHTMAPLAPVGNGFTYQGQLVQSGSPVTGQFDFRFTLWDTLSGGTQIGTTNTITNQSVTGGLFTVTLDFGLNAFNGNARFLQIEVQPNSGGGYTLLTPRQTLNPAPYALFAQDVQPYKNVIVVSPSGGDFTTITAALNSITDASATNHYLIWVGPGIYPEQVFMKQWVDIEGAGEKATTITYTGSAVSGPGTATVQGTNNSELRSLTVTNTGGNQFAIGFYNNGTSPSLLHVTATASGATGSVYPVYNAAGAPSMKDVTMTGSATGGTTCWGLYNNAGQPDVDGVTTTCSGGSAANAGIYNYSYGFSAPSTMRNVRATGSGGAGSTNYGIRNDYSHMAVFNNVTARASGGTNSYGIFNFTSDSPTMTGVTATASGGSAITYGVFNDTSSPTMSNMTISATGGAASNYGLYNTSSSPKMSNLNITASGGAGTIGVLNISSSPTIDGIMTVASGSSGGNYGLYNDSSQPTVRNSSFTGSGGTQSYGLYNSASSGSFTVEVDNSTLAGTTNSIRNDNEFTTRVGASKLDGGTVNANGGTVACAASYDGNNKRLGALCTPDTKVVYVATTGGDFTTITAALNSITDNSLTNRYLVKVGPGNFIERVTMKPYVDIEGAGEDLTAIIFVGTASFSGGTVIGASNAELRSLTVENLGGNNFAVAIFNNGTSPSILHVTTSSGGGTSATYGITNSSSASVNIESVTIKLSGSGVKEGIYNSSSSGQMNNVIITSTGGTNTTGVDNLESSVDMDNVTVTLTGGTMDLFGVYNGLSDTVMNNLSLSVSGGNNTFGIYNNNSSPVMNNVIASGSGAATGNYGVSNYGSQSPILNYVTATGKGGSVSYGVYNINSATTIKHSILSASGGTSNYGLYNTASSGAYTIKIDDSTLLGSTDTISNDSHYIVRVGASKLDGGVVFPNGGTITCAGVYNETYNFFPNTCP